MNVFSNLAARTRVPNLTPRTTRIALTSGILLGGVALSALIVATAQSHPPVPPSEIAAPVTTITVTPGNLAPSITAYGRVESSRVARLRTSIDAPIASVLTHEGDWVTKGTLLLLIEPRQFQLARAERQAELVQAQSQLQSIQNEFATAKVTTAQHQELARIARAKLQRYGDLFSKGMVPVALLDEVREQASQREIVLADHEAKLRDLPNRRREQAALVQRAEALRDRAQLDLDETAVRAPFSGPVLAVKVAAGERSSAPVLIEMADASALEIRAAVADRHLAALRGALDTHRPITARARIDGRDQWLELTHLADGIKSGQGATDVFFAPRAEQSSATTSHDVAAQPRLPLGRVVDVTMALPAAENVVALPIQAIYEGDRVYRVANSRLVAVNVQRVGDFLTADGQLQALVRADELKSGVAVITTQLPNAITGRLVAAIRNAAAQRPPDSRTLSRAGTLTHVAARSVQPHLPNG